MKYCKVALSSAKWHHLALSSDKEYEVKRKYRIVSSCLTVLLSCMCGLSACGESAQTGGTAMGSVNNGTNPSRTVTIREAAIACNIPEWQVLPGYLGHFTLSTQEHVDDTSYSEYLEHTALPSTKEYVDDPSSSEYGGEYTYSRENSSRILHSLTKVIPCVIRELNPDDPKAFELASKVEKTFSNYSPDNLNEYFKENDISFINYVGRSYVIMTHPYKGIKLNAISVNMFNILSSKRSLL